jgi:hypothetical protein
MPYGQVQPPYFPGAPAAPSAAPASPLPAPPPRAVRGKAADEPPPPPVALPARLEMPAPAASGIALTAVETAIDWAAIHRRLDVLGITCCQFERVANGWRVVCLLPDNLAGRHQRVEAQGTSQAEAVRLALSQAEQSAGRKN